MVKTFMLLAIRVCNFKPVLSVVVSGLFTRYKSNMTMKVLNVAEKNDAAKSLSGIMSKGKMRRRDGFSVYNKIYEFDYTIMNQRCHMVMTSVSGHLLGLEFTGNYRNWRSCSPLALFDAPVRKICSKEYQPIKRTLEREVVSCEMLIIWTDCDREGENIGFEIIEVCTAVKPNIKIFRAKFSEITSQSVQRAVQTLTNPDKRISDAVDVRQELDLRIGAAFTRFQTLRLQKVFPETLSNSLISYGSCQFPTLGFVVERYKAIRNFVSETFWKIKVSHTKEELTVDFNWKRVRLFDQMACQVLYDICMENLVATVIKVQGKPKSKWRPLPLDTVELEKLASRKLKLNAKETMRIAEKLYSQGFISYPRTETNIFPKEFDLRNLVNMQCEDQRWGAFARGVLEHGPDPRIGKKSDQAHPPIHPTKHTDNLGGNEKSVYEFIVRHFLACCSKNAEGYETIVEIDINSEKFVASGLMIIARNYLDVYPYETWNAKEIHVYQEGEQFEPTNIEMTDGSTSAPNLLTEADLIALMEKHGIGTDATHAEHIETIKSRLYVGLEDGIHFVPGQLGMGLVDGYDKMGFAMSKPYLRAELESDLKRICDGTKPPRNVLSEQLEKYRNVFRIALEQAKNLDEALAQYLNEPAQQPTFNETVQEELPVTIMKCHRCGSDMVLRTKQDGSSKFVSCMGYPDCKNAVWFPNTVESVTVSNVYCPECGPTVRRLSFKFRSGSMIPYYEDNHIGCIAGCDTNLLELLGVRQSQIHRVSTESGYGSSGNNRHGCNTDGLDVQSNSSQNTNGIVSSLQTISDSNTWNSKHNQNILTRIGNPVMNRTSSTILKHNSSVEENHSHRILGNSPDFGNSHQNKIVCSCNHDAKLLTVRKEGPNIGRKFYKCDMPQGQNCNFFMWADNDDTINTTTPINATIFEQRDTNNTIGVDEVKCNCNLPARRFTVQKEGQNKGRQFYSCCKPQTEKCNFFKWSDDIGDNHSNTSNFGRGIGSLPKRGDHGLSSQLEGNNRRKRKCTSCFQEGHNKRNCPNRGSQF